MEEIEIQYGYMTNIISMKHLVFYHSGCRPRNSSTIENHYFFCAEQIEISKGALGPSILLIWQWV